MYGRSMDGMDKMCDDHPWCTTKITNIENNFGLSFRRFFFCFFLVFVLAIFSVLKKCCDYMCRNGGVSNNTEWIGLTLVPFFYREHCPSNIKIGMKDMLFHTHVYFIMPCSYNIRPLYIS